MRKMEKPMRHGRPVVAAMFLGATLAALAPTPADSRADGAPPHAVLGDVGRYCTTCWRNAHLPVDLWGDCTQDVMQRLLERVPASCWDNVLAEETDERREFLRAIDTV